MVPTQAREAFSKLTAALAANPELENALRVRWHAGGRDGTAASTQRDAEMAEDLRADADLLAETLPGLTHSPEDIAALGELFEEPAGEVLFTWCSASAWRRDTQVARLLAK